jgi:hypothetical protein
MMTAPPLPQLRFFVSLVDRSKDAHITDEL